MAALHAGTDPATGYYGAAGLADSWLGVRGRREADIDSRPRLASPTVLHGSIAAYARRRVKRWRCADDLAWRLGHSNSAYFLLVMFDPIGYLLLL